jgi:MFS family permease
VTETDARVAPVSRAPLLVLLAAVAVSMGGNMLTRVAVPWFVLQTTGDPGRVGIAVFFMTLPTVIAGAFGGALIDRLGLRRTSIIADVASGATIVLIPLLYLTVGLEFWTLLVLVFATALLDAPGETARFALLPDVAESAGVALDRVTSVYDGVVRSARMVGGASAGILAGLVGAANALYVNAATFAVSAVLVSLAVPVAVRSVAPEAATSYWGEIRDGFAFLWNHRLVRALVLLTMLTNMLDYADFAVILPVYADTILDGAFDLGLIFGVFGAGALLGNVLYASLAGRLPRQATLVVAFLVVAGPRFLVLAAAPPRLVILATLFGCGVFAGALNPILQAVLLERIPAHMRGRVIGTVRAGVWALIPLGPLAGGYVVGLVGVRPTLVLIAVLYTGVILGAYLRGHLRELDDRPGRD